MEWEEALEAIAMAVRAKKGTSLLDAEIAVLGGSWKGYTYEQIAAESSYGLNYLKNDIGPNCWKKLTEVFGERVTKKNFRAVLEKQGRSPASPADQNAEIKDRPRQDWGEAPDVGGPDFVCGRAEELATLKQWIIEDRCRIVALLGMEGIGKTTLAAKLAAEIQDEFDYLIWRSLRKAPPIEELLDDLLAFLPGYQPIATDIYDKISQLVDRLHRNRTLVVLDNAEMLLEDKSHVAIYKEGYGDYGVLWQEVALSRHKSCLLAIGQRQLPEISALLEKEPVFFLEVKGLKGEAAKKILRKNNLKGEEKWEALIERYGGNPLALKFVAPLIEFICDGNVAELLEEFGTTVLLATDYKNILAEYFENKLSSLEKEIMKNIATQDMSVKELQEKIPERSQLELIEALKSLRWRSLLEKKSNQSKFTLQPVIGKYIEQNPGLFHTSKDNT